MPKDWPGGMMGRDTGAFRTAVQVDWQDTTKPGLSVAYDRFFCSRVARTNVVPALI